MTFLFLTTLFVSFIIITALVEQREEPHPIWAAFVIIGVLSLVEFTFFKGTFINLKELFIHNPTIPLLCFVVYLLNGIIWSFIKWKLYLNKKVNEITNKRKKEDHDYYLKQLNPSLSENRERIITWLTYWPFSLVWFLVHKPFIELYNLFSKCYNKMFENAIKNNSMNNEVN